MAALLAVAALAPLPLAAAPASVDLGHYTLTGSFLLPPIEAEEASAITYNWDTDTLFVLGDEGDALVEVSKTGAKLSAMTLTGFADTEGLTYIGGGQFVITEERIRDAYRFSYTAGGSVNRAGLAVKDLGTDVGNSGIEGISYDARDGSFVTVKEVNPQEVNRVEMDFDSATAASIVPLFSPTWGRRPGRCAGAWHHPLARRRAGRRSPAGLQPGFEPPAGDLARGHRAVVLRFPCARGRCGRRDHGLRWQHLRGRRRRAEPVRARAVAGPAATIAGAGARWLRAHRHASAAQPHVSRDMP
ncbi:MAG: SdiA-regulated domain-containing protein [Proteobacteria bacterium]|nr:SdiA-regulated domain-containing protein [Pseudomonadota bacterium]